MWADVSSVTLSLLPCPATALCARTSLRWRHALWRELDEEKKDGAIEHLSWRS